MFILLFFKFRLSNHFPTKINPNIESKLIRFYITFSSIWLVWFVFGLFVCFVGFFISGLTLFVLNIDPELKSFDCSRLLDVSDPLFGILFYPIFILENAAHRSIFIRLLLVIKNVCPIDLFFSF
jgi:hypothetical protein